MLGEFGRANRRRGFHVPLPETSNRMKAVRQEGTWAELAVRQALSAGRAYLAGCALSALLEIVFSLIMIAIFVWRAFFA